MLIGSSIRQEGQEASKQLFFVPRGFLPFRASATPTGHNHRSEVLVVVPAGAMHVAVFQFFRRRLAHGHDLHIEM